MVCKLIPPSIGPHQNLSNENFENFCKIYFVSLVLVKIIRRFGFGPIYAKLIVTIAVA